MVRAQVRSSTTVMVLLVVIAIFIAAQASDNVHAQATKYPYPTKRDLAATIPPGPKLLPSPPLGAGPWTYRTTEANIKVSVVARGISHPYAFAFLPDGDILVTERVGKLRVIHN